MPVEPVLCSRVLNPHKYVTTLQVYTNAPTEVGAYMVRDWEYRSSRHHLWSYRRLAPNCDFGGSFHHVMFTDQRSTYPLVMNVGGTYKGTRAYQYRGSLMSLPSSPSASAITNTRYALELDPLRMSVLGTGLVSKASPTRSQAQIATSLVELKRDGFPSIAPTALLDYYVGKRRPKNLLKKTGSDYLNWQFGWVPFVNDVRSMATSVMRTEALLSQLYRDSGKVVRRKSGSPSHWTTVDDTSSEVLGYGYPQMVPVAYSAYPSKVFTSTRTTRATWFSGAFRYHLPDNVAPLGQLRRLAVDARYLYGLSASPDVLWNVVPWSWLVDWFVNVGEVLSNVSDQVNYQQVMKYGYVMAHTVRTVRTEATISLANGYTATPSSLQTYDVKQRLHATPYGFGLNWSGFTPNQLGILAALGASQRL